MHIHKPRLLNIFGAIGETDFGEKIDSVMSEKDAFFSPRFVLLSCMNAITHWQRIAERLSESGWSWKHVRLDDRVGRNLHVAEAHNEDGMIHATVAKSVGPAFVAFARSIKSMEK